MVVNETGPDQSKRRNDRADI